MTTEDLFSWLDSQLATQMFAADSLEMESSSSMTTTNGNGNTTGESICDDDEDADAASDAHGRGGIGDLNEESNRLQQPTSSTTSTTSPPRTASIAENDNNSNLPEETDVDDDDDDDGGGGGGDDDDDDEYDDDAERANDDEDYARLTFTSNRKRKVKSSTKLDSAVPRTVLMPSSVVVPIASSQLQHPTLMLPPPPKSLQHSARSAAKRSAPNGSVRSSTSAVSTSSKRNKTQQQQSCTYCSKAHRKCVVPARHNGRNYSCSACSDRGLECSFQSLPIFLSPARLLSEQADAFAEPRVLPSALASTIRHAIIRTSDDVANASVAFLGSTPQYVMSIRPRTPAETLAHGIPLPVFTDANDEFCRLVNRDRNELKLTPLFEVLRPRGDANRWAGWANYVAPPETLTLDISSTPIYRTAQGWRQCRAHVKFYFQQDGPFAGRIAAVHGSIEQIGTEDVEEPPIPALWSAMAQSMSETDGIDEKQQQEEPHSRT